MEKWGSMADSIIEYTDKMNPLWKDFLQDVSTDALSQGMYFN